jgi:threonine dehydrogenase-like Zn-dependent dehydrogenase
VPTPIPRVDLTPLVTHHFALDDIKEAFDLFAHQGGGVLKVACIRRGRRPIECRR